jgi:hypothetical protein
MLLLPRAAVVLQAGLLAELSSLVRSGFPDESCLTPLLHPPDLEGPKRRTREGGVNGSR